MDVYQIGNSSEIGEERNVSNSDKGFVRFIPLQSGITLATIDCMLDEPVSISFTPPPETIAIGFSLSGNMELNPAGWNSNVGLHSGLSHFSWFPAVSDFTETIEKGRIRRVCLMVPRDLLYKYIEHYTQDLPRHLEVRSSSPTHIMSPLTPGMRAILPQIFACPYQGISREFFIESKAMELLTYKFEQLGLCSLQERISLPSNDVEGVGYAAGLLTEDLEDPKSLEQIARAVGMCRSKLHEKFRIVYGMTPFEYQRDFRLDIAKQYLLESTMSITEIAFAVGYSSSGYFTKAFKKRYGELPGEYRKKLLS
ncbi:helix-turn-helix transcriptional regulator [Maridesulfovibrio sp.]|uniref:helix-turn-helix transcriptional regulator n=1 Tax=Maridesulfovibrio sp. TaxID=2795000 RepID=UPI003BAD351E